MARTPTAAEKPEAEKVEETGAVVRVAAGLPAEFSDEMAEFAGAGISDRQEDFLLPFLYVAQSNSPQTKRQQADKYIVGLEAGDIFNTATGRYYKSDVGTTLIPAYFQRAEVEWVLRSNGGGYVATHDPDTVLKSQVRVVDDKGKIDPKGRFRMLPNGNQLVETAYHFCIDLSTMSPVVVGLTSTGLQTSRQWTTLMRDAKIRDRSGSLVMAPCFARAFQLSSAYRQNDTGDWFMPIVRDLGWANQSQEMNDGRQMAKEFFVHASKNGVQMGRPPAAEADQHPGGIAPGADRPADYEEPPI
jgi:hypothetical protein